MALDNPDLPKVLYPDGIKAVGSLILKDGRQISFLKAPMTIEEIKEIGGSDETGSGAKVVIRGKEFHAAGIARVVNGRVWFRPSKGEIYSVPNDLRINYVETADLQFMVEGVQVEVVPIIVDEVDDPESNYACIGLSKGEYYVYPQIYTPRSLKDCLLRCAGVTI